MKNPFGDEALIEIKDNMKRLAPAFWVMMEYYSVSLDAEKQKIFLTEFNKIQSKMIPVGFDPTKPFSIQQITGMSISETNQLVESEDVKELSSMSEDV